MTSQPILHAANYSSTHMNTFDCNTLETFLQRYCKHQEITELLHRLDTLKQKNASKDGEALLQLYHEAIPHIESSIWSEGIDESSTELYQHLFQELEHYIAQTGHDSRHDFIITIPVADRPQHLASCLQSLLHLCQKFNYGGYANGHYSKISVLIADDSKDNNNISQNQAITQQFNQQGLTCHYFGQQEQQQQLRQLAETDRIKLQHILGNIDRNNFYHKGASIMRNISYLKLNELKLNYDNPLFYFIDSDQEFRIKINSDNGDQDVFAVNFFYHLDRIFSTSNTQVLTGKVVGDPPVSPAVMAGNFLDDVIDFLKRMSTLKPEQDCQFHQLHQNKPDDASYHDMADLFGFKPADTSFQYNCTLSTQHNHLSCFDDFANKLNHFFDGEHPTRKTYYEHEDVSSHIKDARTIYTGNYIFNANALKYFIPFATLKLRMAGPVLGRIIKSELGSQFVSANLPMLHTRTVQSLGQSEFRAGIHHADDHIDLSGEFERQFFGDVMLFTIETLTEHGYPEKLPNLSFIEQTLNTTASKLQHMYAEKRQRILDKLAVANKIFNEPTNWWQQLTETEQANENFERFIHNIEYNFGDQSPAFTLINSETQIQQHHAKLLHAITTYPEDRTAWQHVLS